MTDEINKSPLSPIHPSLIATLATGPAIEDLRILLGSLAIFNAIPPTVYLFCDADAVQRVRALKYPGKLVVNEALEAYAGLTRKEMERMPSVKGGYPNLWFQFMAEKLNLLDWVFAAEPKLAAEAGVLFCDADICFCAPLPLVPGGTVLGLSPHMIRMADEARFGAYNGGFLWMSDVSLVDTWRRACVSDPRFFEQACLETVAAEVKGVTGKVGLYEFPITQNYGWWRMWQGRESADELKKAWTMSRIVKSASGILIGGQPLGSIHTHFTGPGAADYSTRAYNDWVIAWLKRLAPFHMPAKRLLGLVAGAGAGTAK
jgi:hypothetical protein